MSEVKWIRITTNIFDDEKIKLIDTMPDRDALLVIWFKLLALAGKTNDDGYVYVMKKMPTNAEILATVFNRPINTVRLALETFENFGMIEIEDHISIVNWEKHQNIDGLDKIKEQNRLRQQKYREKKKVKAIENKKSNVTSRDSNAPEEDKNRIEKEKKQIELFFCDCWKLYPKKKGKGSISDSKKKELYKLGDEFKRCIERYNAEINKNKTEEKYIKQGSTFFNSGYVDYLDENYTEIEKKEKNRSKAEILEDLGISF